MTPFFVSAAVRSFTYCSVLDAQQAVDYGRVTRHVRRRQVRVPPHHRRRLPTAHFPQVVQRGAVLDQPAGPGVSQVVPTEVGNSCALEGIALSLRVHVPDGFAFIREDALRMFPTLAL